MNTSADIPNGDEFPADASAGSDQNLAPPTRNRGRWPEILVLILVLLFGIGVRLWLLLLGPVGDSFDTGLFASWTRGMVNLGLGEFFETETFCDYPPLAMLIFWAVGHIAALFDGAIAVDGVLYPCLKIPACLADLAIALMLYVEGRRLVGGWRAVGAAAIYVLNPLPLYDSGFWGQVDSIHAALVLLSLVLLNRGWWGLAGLAVGLAILQKFQSIAFVPLVLFEGYRYLRWRGVGKVLLGATVAAGFVFLPFAVNGVLGEVLSRSYVDVVGQYPNLAKGAYNIWQLADDPGASDVTVPGVVAHIVADGRVGFPENDSPLMMLTLRHISLTAYAICVALILTVFSYRPGAIARCGAAGLLFVAFFLIPTEMHERYALPAIAVLALWAVTDVWKERAYFLLSALLLLNLTAALPVHTMAKVVSGMIASLFAIMLIAPIVLRWARHDEAEPLPELPDDAGPPAGASALIRWFRRAAWTSAVVFLGGVVLIGYAAAHAKPLPDDGLVRYLSTLAPVRTHQGWGRLRLDRSVSGGVIHLGDVTYVSGLGTHAPSTLVYAIPDGFDAFEATVGVSRYTEGGGSVVVSVLLDEEVAFKSEMLTGTSEPVSISVPLKGAALLTLKAEATPDGKKNDHVDWAAARFVRGEAEVDID